MDLAAVRAATPLPIAVGFGIAQQMMQQGLMNPNAPSATPVAGGTAPAAASAPGSPERAAFGCGIAMSIRSLAVTAGSRSSFTSGVRITVPATRPRACSTA